MRPGSLALALLAPTLATNAQVAQTPIPPDWQTRAEASSFAATSTYDETVAFLRRLQARSPSLSLSFFGNSAQGRALPLVVVSKDRLFRPRRARELSTKPIVLIQNAIHAGEVDGKDASLILLRDIAFGRHPELLDAATLLIIPIYNVDGHERVSPHNRPNQDGPREGQGYRTTASGLDLNRDHLKLDSEEARALVALVSEWRPHLHVDNHVSDGYEHELVLGYTYAEAPQAPAAVAAWLEAHVAAAAAAANRAGARVGRYMELRDENDPARGATSRAYQPRFSTGYFPLRNRPSVLIETHSYRPFGDRVRANVEFLLALLEQVRVNGGGLRRAVEDAEAVTVSRGRPGAAPSEVALAYDLDETASEKVSLPTYAWQRETSVVTGQPVVRYQRGTVRETEMTWHHRPRAARLVPRPRGYVVLPGWTQVGARLQAHGLRVESVAAPAEVDAESLYVSKPAFNPGSYQGLHQVSEMAVERTPLHTTVPAGALWVPADQPDFEVAVQLLEPEAPDSLVSWGLLSTTFERREMMSDHLLEGLARTLLEDPKVAAAWQEALADPAFARDAAARRDWMERRTPFWDPSIGQVPVLRIMKAPPFAIAPPPAVRPGRPAAPRGSRQD
jgi:murein tripeptide amidase MpaA